MERWRPGWNRDRIWAGVKRLFAEEHTPHEVALSFAIGVFITAVPTAGTAVVIFAAIAYCFDRVSKVALVATLVIFNPVVKWSVYGASIWLGIHLLGPVPGASLTDPALSAGPAILVRQLLGNGIIAITLAGIGYIGVWVLVSEYRRRTTYGIDVTRDSVPD